MLSWGVVEQTRVVVVLLLLKFMQKWNKTKPQNLLPANQHKVSADFATLWMPRQCSVLALRSLQKWEHPPLPCFIPPSVALFYPYQLNQPWTELVLACTSFLCLKRATELPTFPPQSEMLLHLNGSLTTAPEHITFLHIFIVNNP